MTNRVLEKIAPCVIEELRRLLSIPSDQICRPVRWIADGSDIAYAISTLLMLYEMGLAFSKSPETWARQFR
jgi:hypothetical protein